MKAKPWKSDLSLLFITAVWGISFVLTKNTLEEIPPIAFVLNRFLIASATMLLMCLRQLKELTLRVVKQGIAQGTMLLLGIILQIVGLRYTTASNAAFITGLSVVFVPVISSILNHKAPGVFALVGVALSLVGLFFLSGGAQGFQGGINPGDLLCLTGSLGFSLHIILVDRWSDQNAFSLQTLLQILTVTLGSGITFAFSHETPPTYGLPSVAVLLWTGVLGTAVAYTVQNWAQRNTEPTHTAMIVAAEPVFGVLFATVIPGASGKAEQLTATGAFGCCSILLAILLTELGEKIFHLIKNRKKGNNADRSV